MNLKHNFLNFVYRHQRIISKSCFLILFGWFPIKKNKIVFCNFSGGGYGCNPKYISDEIINQNLSMEIVWLTRPDFMNKEKFPKCLRLVNIKSIRAIYELATARIWINNSHKIGLIKRGLQKKKGQLYINTWHGSLGIKRIDGDVQRFMTDAIWKSIIEQDSKMIDIMTSNSEFETNVYRRAIWFKNKIIEVGHPRNDIFFRDNIELKKNIKQKLGLKENDKIIIYLPSYRDDYRINCFNLDYIRLQKTLNKSTGDSWKVLTKFHPRNLIKLEYLVKDMNIKDISYYPDIQELLILADAIISDYSSCMFDFILTKKPCFIYASDIEKYNNERGFYYPLEETPFPIARNNDEMESNILNFNQEAYIKEVEEFLAQKQCTDDGHASERVVEIIKNFNATH